MPSLPCLRARHTTRSLGLGLFLLSGFAVGIAAPARAQSDASLKAADNARGAAGRAGDAKSWAKYTTDDFTVIGVDGTVSSKQERMAGIAGHPRTADLPKKDEHWRTYGATTAIQTFWREPATSNEKPARATTVWVKQHGTWKVASVVISEIRKP